MRLIVTLQRDETGMIVAVSENFGWEKLRMQQLKGVFATPEMNRGEGGRPVKYTGIGGIASRPSDASVPSSVARSWA